ncbi:hypothetical protein Tco_0408545 [Tanacetum coccineum]
MNRNNQKRLMRADELYKFSDGTLKDVRDNLHDMLHNFKLGYNAAMPKRKWSEKDQEWTTKMLIIRLSSNISYVAGKTDYEELGVLCWCQNQKDLPGDTPLVRVEVFRITQLIAGIEDNHHGPSDVMHNPP